MSSITRYLKITLVAIVLGAAGIFLLSDYHNNPADQQLHTILPDGTLREHHIYVPDTLSSNQSHPLVIMLHGGGVHPHSAQEYAGWNTLARKEEFIVSYPIGKSPNDDITHACWNADKRYCPHDAKDLLFLELLLEDLQEQLDIDPDRIYLAGFSVGGLFAHKDVFCNLSDTVAAIASVDGGVVYTDCAGKIDTPLLFFQNPNRSPVEGLQAFAIARECELDIVPSVYQSGDSLVTRTEYTGCRHDSDLVLYAPQEAPHAWFSMAKEEGGEVESITHIIWDFFSKQQL